MDINLSYPPVRVITLNSLNSILLFTVRRVVRWISNKYVYIRYTGSVFSTSFRYRPPTRTDTITHLYYFRIELRRTREYTMSGKRHEKRYK